MNLPAWLLLAALALKLRTTASDRKQKRQLARLVRSAREKIAWVERDVLENYRRLSMGAFGRSPERKAHFRTCTDMADAMLARARAALDRHDLARARELTEEARCELVFEGMHFLEETRSHELVRA